MLKFVKKCPISCFVINCSGRFEGCVVQFTSGSELLAEKLQSVLKELGFNFNIQKKILLLEILIMM